MANKKTPNKITNKQLRQIDKAAIREKRKSDGAFDGRFRPKVVPNKTKNQPPPIDD